MAGDFFSTLGKAVGKGISDTAKQLDKTANDVADGVAKSLDEFTQGVNKEINDVGEKAKQGDFLGAAIELTEVGNMGSIASEAAAAFGFGPKDPVGKELASGVINFMTGNPLGALKDAGDAFKALSAGAQPGTAPAPSHSPPKPKVAFERCKHHVKTHAHAHVGIRLNGGYASIDINIHVHGHKHHHMIRPGCGAPAWNNWMNLNPIIMRPPAVVLGNMIGNAIRDALENVGAKPSGPPVREKPAGEKTSIGDILNDPTLCFEDMVAMVMAQVCADMQEQVREQIEKLEGMTAKKDGAGSSGKSDGKKGASGASGAEGGKEAGGAQGGKESGGGGIPGLVTDPKEMAFVALDAIAFGPVGVLIGQGLMGGSISKKMLGSLDPKMIGGVVDGLKGLTPVLAPIVSGALAAFPPIGTAIAPFVPMLLPVVMDVAGGALQQAAGAANGGAGGSGGAGKKPDPSQTAPGGGSMGGTGGKTGGAGEKDQNSINVEMEKLKLLMQRMQEMQQAMSNVLNTMHQGAMNSIRNIK